MVVTCSWDCAFCSLLIGTNNEGKTFCGDELAQQAGF